MSVDLTTLEIPDAQPLEHAGGVCELRFPGNRTVVIPKAPDDFLDWRRDLLRRGEQSERFRRTMMALVRELCPEAFILWFNAFGWLFKQQRVREDGHQMSVKGRATNVPANLWPCQDEAIRCVFDAIHDGHDLVVDKSRQMGVTVLIAGVFDCWFLYQPAAVFLVMSEKEALVDNPDDPYSVFWKIDYVHDRLVWWARPDIRHPKRLLLVNKTNGSTILGRATTADTGRGGALLAALIDEAASIPELEAIKTALADATSCRIANSTPKGPGVYSDMVADGSWPVLRMPWWNHPEKGRGRTLAYDEAIGEVYVTSPFYEKRVARAGGRLTPEVAQELDMKHAMAGSSFFDQSHVLRQKAQYATDPTSVVQLGLSTQLGEDDWIRHLCDHEKPDPLTATLKDFDLTMGGNLALWVDLEETRRGGLRPPQRLTYAIGADIGQGQNASHSVASVFALEMGRKVAELTEAGANPHEFARVLALLGIWFGGATRLPPLNIEVNGPGLTVIRQLQKLHYGRIMRRINKGPANAKQGEKLGWWSSTATKQDLLQEYRAALNTDAFINHSAKALEEASKYVRYANGSIGPGRLEHESSDAKATHGDRVIADGLVWQAAQALGVRSAAAELEPPAGSPAADELVLRRIETAAKSKAPKTPGPKSKTWRGMGRRW